MHMYPNDFIIDDRNVFLNTAYENENFKIMKGISGGGEKGICLIFCSGNGLYANELGAYKEAMICNDRYEWAHVAAEMIHYVKKIVFVRDIRKNFYVTGINHKINCIDKLIEMLKDQCMGYKIITIGNSAGGYIASIIGVKLHAQTVFNFSGQWNLYGLGSVINNFPFLIKFAHSEIHNKYYDITQLVNHCDVPIFYFYPQESEQDIRQAAYVNHIRNIYFFIFDSDKHGQGLPTTESYAKLLLCDNESLKELSNSYHGIPLKPDKMDAFVSNLSPYKTVFREPSIAEKKPTLADKHLALFRMMNQWVKVKQEGKNLASSFEQKGYKKIAIYGLSYAGETLIRELQGTNVQIAYGIDRNADSICVDIDVVTMEEKLSEVDAVVVTAISYFQEIKNKLIEKIKCPVISLEDILYEL